MKYSLIIGRFQPLKDEQKKLIRTSLDEGNNVCVALRDTDQDENNPYEIDDRMLMFADEFGNEMKSEQLLVIAIPDVEDVTQIKEDTNEVS